MAPVDYRGSPDDPFNASYQVPITAPVFLKTGASWRVQRLDIWGKDNRGFKDRTQRTLMNFVTITAGVNGRF